MRVAYPSVGKAFRSVKLAWCSYLAVLQRFARSAVSIRSSVQFLDIRSSVSFFPTYTIIGSSCRNISIALIGNVLRVRCSPVAGKEELIGKRRRTGR